ncbi:MAG TPA: site-specific integrase [Candidatus Acidoferrales bacterium]|nr:site-specific integrase [Candidatus Acidoferrales bacterium]
MRPNLPRYVGLVRAKGSDYLYFRRHGQRWRLPDDPATPEFQKAYPELLGRTNFDPVLRRVADGSVAALVRDYRGSDEFIRELRKGFAGKGRTQQLFGQVASLLFNFAVDNDYCETNPASRMKRVGRARAYRAWTDAECGAFEASNPVRHVMTGYMLGRYTGQRRGDVFGRISPTYLGTRSSSLSKPGARRDKLQQGLPQALHTAGLAHLHFHGLRHTAGAALAEAGCSEKEIMAVLGHKTLSMVQKYTAGARRKRLATSAIAKLEGTGTGTERESAKLDE